MANSDRSKPRLAYVVNSLNPGGTEKLVVEMSKSLSEDFNVTVVCLDEPGEWANDLRRAGIPVYVMWRQPGLDVGMALKLARFFRKHEIQIIHAHQCTPWFYSALSRLIYSAPRLLLEEHGRFFPEIENKKRKIVNRAIIKNLTHRFVAVSEDVKNRLVIFEGLNSEEIEVVYNGVIPEDPIDETKKNDIRSGFNFHLSDFVVGTVGRFDPIKNLPLLVRSLADAIKKNAKVKCLLVGNGPSFKEIGDLVQSMGLKNHIILSGFRSDARKLIQCMDLFVLSSFSEGTSMALLEAMSAGVPVIVTDVGGNPEVVVHGQTGWVVASDDRNAMSAAILDAVNNPDKHREYGMSGKSRFDELFTFDLMISNYRQIYREILQ